MKSENFRSKPSKQKLMVPFKTVDTDGHINGKTILCSDQIGKLFHPTFMEKGEQTEKKSKFSSPELVLEKIHFFGMM